MKEFIRSIIFILGVICTKNKKKSKIVYYHDFYDKKRYTYMSTSLDLFRKHLQVASSLGYKIVPDIKNEDGELAIMLDDGFRGVWDCRDFFISNNIKPTIFIAKSLVGTEGYLSESEIKELDCLGWNIQSHTVAHTNLNDFNENDLEYQLKESKRYLENLLGHPIDSICAPQGKFSNIVAEKAYKCGYSKFYSSVSGFYHERITDYTFVFSRNLCQFLTPFQFWCVMQGGEKFFQKIDYHRMYIKF